MIKETEWTRAVNTLTDYKYIYTFLNGYCYIAVASRTHGVGFSVLPLEKKGTMIVKWEPEENDEEEVRANVQKWIDAQPK